MKKFNAIFFTLFCLLFFIACEKEIIPSQSVPSEIKLIEVVFEEPISLSKIEFINEIEGVNLVQVSVEFIDEDSKKSHWGGKIFKDDDEFNLGDFLSESQATIDEILRDNINFPQNLEGENFKSNSLKIDVNKGRVNSFKLSGSYTSIEEAIPFINELHGEWKYLNLIPSNLTPRSLRNSSWSPNRGLVRVYPSSVGVNNRYVRHDFLWESANPFSAWYTYEHDFFLNNFDGSELGPGTYFSREQNYWGYPIVDFWISDLPSAYLDTRFLDEFGVQGSETEVPYTIGSGNADAIIGNFQYYSYIRIQKGDANQDNGKINAQLGTQIPVGCTSEWCSFAVQNDPLIPAWNISIPGYKFWNN